MTERTVFISDSAQCTCDSDNKSSKINTLGFLLLRRIDWSIVFNCTVCFDPMYLKGEFHDWEPYRSVLSLPYFYTKTFKIGVRIYTSNVLCLFLDIFGRSCVEWLTHGTVRTLVQYRYRYILCLSFNYLTFSATSCFRVKSKQFNFKF